jgi:hypothetical protein
MGCVDDGMGVSWKNITTGGAVDVWVVGWMDVEFLIATDDCIQAYTDPKKVVIKIMRRRRRRGR